MKTGQEISSLVQDVTKTLSLSAVYCKRIKTSEEKNKDRTEDPADAFHFLEYCNHKQKGIPHHVMEPGKPIWNSTLLTNILPCSFPSFIYELLVMYWVSAKAVALGFNTACQVIIPLIVIPGYLLSEILWIFQLKSSGTTRDINSLSPDCYDSNSPNSYPASSKVSFSWYCTLSTSKKKYCTILNLRCNILWRILAGKAILYEKRLKESLQNRTRSI